MRGGELYSEIRLYRRTAERRKKQMILRLDEVGALLRGSLGYSKKRGTVLRFRALRNIKWRSMTAIGHFSVPVRAAMWENILIFIMTAV